MRKYRISNMNYLAVFFSEGSTVERGPGGSMSQVVGSNSSYKSITNTAWVRAWLCKSQKGCTRLAAASDKVYQLFAHGRWFSPGTPASSTTKTARHDIAEILLEVALNSKNSNHSNVARTKLFVIVTLQLRYKCALNFYFFSEVNVLFNDLNCPFCNVIDLIQPDRPGQARSGEPLPNV